GLAERAWGPAPVWETTQDKVVFQKQYAESWSQFANQLGKRELPRLDAYAGGFQYRIPPPGAVVRGGKLYVNQQLPGFALRYTTDGSAPTASSVLYTGPVAVAANGTVKIRAFDTRGRGGRVMDLPVRP
ncbi:MAG: chitobiase/beta-hexosaminidase C-terminal domain-containing protein, partial [Saprospiraceae bacterium]|nr:chitobiase/beta-hexosaminidase C-terminal domain-containing protein [Saprospiraceae bacterium]